MSWCEMSWREISEMGRCEMRWCECDDSSNHNIRTSQDLIRLEIGQPLLLPDR